MAPCRASSAATAGAHGVAIGHVERRDVGAPPSRSIARFAVSSADSVAAVQHDERARVGEPVRDREAEAARGAGDERDAPG